MLNRKSDQDRIDELVMGDGETLRSGMDRDEAEHMVRRAREIADGVIMGRYDSNETRVLALEMKGEK